jgi:hypothetical protein
VTSGARGAHLGKVGAVSRCRLDQRLAEGARALDDGAARLAPALDEKLQDALRRAGQRRELLRDDRRGVVVDDRQQPAHERLEGGDRRPIAVCGSDEEVGLHPQDHGAEIEFVCPREREQAGEIR